MGFVRFRPPLEGGLAVGDYTRVGRNVSDRSLKPSGCASVAGSGMPGPARARVTYAAGPSYSMSVQVQFTFSVEQLMRPETVKALLQKIEFSPSPSDGTLANCPDNVAKPANDAIPS